ncbi:MAG: cytochrome c biogenesis protein CcdA [Actinomycetota bacterium]|nr:cytochrome c biogenesis protein CcdA [Actinomycetota bacterium]
MADPTTPIALVPVAFAAGLVSFLSPCVLPIVPGYLSYMSGLGASEEERSSLRTGLVACAFVLGFTLVFVPLGASATYLGSFLQDQRDVLAKVGGVLIIAMGLIFMGVIKVPWLYREARFHPSPKAGAWGSVVLGAAFAFGWSPCIGATMATALTMAAGLGTSGSPAEGALLLAVYSLGLGIPFVLAGVGVSRLTGALTWLRKHTRTVNLVSGVLLVGVGILFLTDQIFQISIWMQRGFTSANLDFWNF